MSTTKIESFSVAGIAIRTTNENGQSSTDIPALWNTFMAENIAAKIPGKISDTIYCIYTEYEKDHTKPYTTVLGCKVKNPDAVPAGMKTVQIQGGTYEEFSAKGDLTKGIVFQTWLEIWASDIRRSFTTDFEIYGEKAQDPANAEVDILVAVK